MEKLIELKTIKGLSSVMKKEPILCDYGLGLYNGHVFKSKDERREVLKKEKERLKKNINTITWCVDWLKENIKPIKTINHNHSSYGLKHIAERFHPDRYITNGAFIAAALIVGYKMSNDAPNPYFAMSERSIKQTTRARKE